LGCFYFLKILFRSPILLAFFLKPPLNAKKMPNSNGQATAAVPVQMNHIEAQLVDEEDGDNNNIAGGGEESIDNTNSIQFEDGGCSGVVGEAVAASDMYVSTNGGGGADYGLVTANNDQLTLSFQGEVYVFDAVAPDKVSTCVCFEFNSPDKISVLFFGWI
jgi:hypothetical protein